MLDGVAQLTLYGIKRMKSVLSNDDILTMRKQAWTSWLVWIWKHFYQWNCLKISEIESIWLIKVHSFSNKLKIQKGCQPGPDFSLSVVATHVCTHTTGHAARTLHARTLHARCMHVARTLHARCTHAACTLHARCTHVARTLHARCTHVARTLHAPKHTLHTLHTHTLHTHTAHVLTLPYEKVSV